MPRVQATTWSTTFKGANVNLSNGNLTATWAATVQGIGANQWLNGKTYFEVQMGATAGTPFGVGICNQAGGTYGTDNNSIALRNSGQVFLNNTAVTTINTYGALNDVVQVAYDPVNQLIWWNVNNGLWNNSGTANPATGVGGISVSTMALGSPTTAIGGASTGAIFNAKFSAASFIYTPPSGFLSIDQVQSPAKYSESRDGPFGRYYPPGRTHKQLCGAGIITRNNLVKGMPVIPISAATVSGVVQESGSPVPFKLVRAFNRQTGEYIGQAYTDASGQYTIFTNGKKLVDVVAYDLPGFNALIWANVTPG